MDTNLLIRILIINYMNLIYNQMETNISSLRMGSFNIQNLSLKKMSDEFIFQKIIEIIKWYDILFILELCGNENNVKEILSKIVDKLNNTEQQNKYKFIHSNKTGLTSGSAEFIGCIYKSNYGFNLMEFTLGSEQISTINNQLNLIDPTNLINPTKLNIFNRQPFIISLNYNQKQIFFIVNHISPKNVMNELEALNTLFNYLYENKSEAYYFLLGDYNADGAYLTKKEIINCKLFSNEKLCSLTDNEITNLSNSLRKYDRIFCSKNVVECNKYNNYLLNTVDSDKNMNGFCDVDKYYNRIKIYDCSYVDTISKINNLNDKILYSDIIDKKYLQTASEFLEKIIINKCKLISDHLPIYCSINLT